LTGRPSSECSSCKPLDIDTLTSGPGLITSEEGIRERIILLEEAKGEMGALRRLRYRRLYGRAACLDETPFTFRSPVSSGRCLGGRGSNPLGSTLEMCRSAGKIRAQANHPHFYPRPCAATVQQRGREPAKVTVSNSCDLWSSVIAQIRSGFNGNGLSIHGQALLTLDHLVLVRIQVRQLLKLPANYRKAETFRQ
jgi:hypothetical protein